MGRGVIIEHLGDAHYRVGLDIDLSYARRQLADIEAYLAAFAEAYAAAGARVDAAKAALAPINDRLTAYLTAAQQACQEAYDAERAAYDEWVDAINSQPDPGGLAFLASSRDAANSAYLAAPTLETLLAVSAADGQWQTACGDALDPAAVALATDAKDAAQADVLSAAEALADELITQAQYDAYVDAYETARGVWITAISANTGDRYVAAKKAAFDAAKAAFDAARQALGKLLNNGGVPEELAAIMADQEKAWAEYRAALQDYAALTLTKTEKETQAAYLRSRLLPYTDNDGEPVLEPVNAWCCDYTEDLAEGATVATIEIPGERDLAIRVRPGYESRETWTAARDGLLTPSFASSPEATYFNWALHPGNARWNPCYRLGEILLIDRQAGTCTVQLDQQTTNEKSRAINGAVLDVNNPVKYERDPQTEELIAVLPGPNVQVADGITTLTDVPIEYMECGAEIFEVGDHVMVEFSDRLWTTPKVIGFAEEPRPCSLRGVVLGAAISTAIITQPPELLFLKDPATGSPPELKHPRLSGIVQGGAEDWTSGDGRYCVNWLGPHGRAIAPAIAASVDPFRPTDVFVGDYYRRWLVYAMDQAGARHYFMLSHLFGASIYRNGAVLATVPAYYMAIGACIVVWQGVVDGQSVTRRYLVAAWSRAQGAEALDPPGNDYQQYSTPLDTELVRHTFAWAALKTSGVIAGEDWHIAHQQDFADQGIVLPPMTSYAFSASGALCAACVPTGVINENHAAEKRVVVGNDLIVRGVITPGPDGVTITTAVTAQAQTVGRDEWSWARSSAANDPYYDIPYPGGASSTSSTRETLECPAVIVGIDFVGETEVTLTAHYSRLYDATYDASGEWVEESGGTGHSSGYGGTASGGSTITETLELRDDYRDRVIGRVESTWNNTYTQDAPFEPYGGYITYGSHSTISNAITEQPLYYDLRHGEWLSQTITLSGTNSGLSTRVAVDYRDITSTQQTAAALRLADAFAYGRDYTDEWSEESSENVYDPLGPENFGGIGGGETGYESFSATLDYTGEGVANRVRQKSYQSSGSDRVALPYCVALRTDAAGHLVHHLELENIAVGRQTHTVIDKHASGFDLTEAWQAHLDSNHPDGVSGRPITSTDPYLANMMPLFRV